MIKSEEELLQVFDSLSDEELLRKWNAQSVVDEVKPILLKALQSRGLNPTQDVNSQELFPGQIADLAEDSDDDENLGPAVTIARCNTGFEAHILRGRLEAEGIPAIVVDEHLINAYSLISAALGGVRVQVPKAFVDNALMILKEIEENE